MARNKTKRTKTVALSGEDEPDTSHEATREGSADSDASIACIEDDKTELSERFYVTHQPNFK